jgi:zinc transporter 1/2/3
MMEVGCIFHSVIIGIGVGVIVDDRSKVLALLLALTFHQLLEGVSLGSVVGMAGFSRIKSLFMVGLYSLTTPFGIAIGIAMAASYNNPESTTVRHAMQGTLSGVSGGMLLYVALVQVIGEEFTRQDLNTRPRLKLGMLASAALGAGLMCILALWA